MLSFLVYRGEQSTPQTPIFVFLHGIGEAYTNALNGRTGFKNLFQQGIPRVLYDPVSLLRETHPLRADSVVVVAPLLMARESPWTEEGNDKEILHVLDGLAPEGERRVYLVGFSKGGQAAFRLAGAIKPRAIVTIDASPMGEAPDKVAKEISECPTPFWSIYTRYPVGHGLEKIPKMHDALAVGEHPVKSWDRVTPPEPKARCKSLVSLEAVDPKERHGELCTRVTASSVPFEWMTSQ